MMQVGDPWTLKQDSADFDRLFGHSIGFYGVWITRIGRRMKLLDCLSAHPMNIDELIFTTML
jgi:hypothetical protein